MTIFVQPTGSSVYLSDYILEVQRLLHDANGNYWSVAELTSYINDARNRVVGDTGCNRILQQIYLTQYATTATVLSGGSGYVVGDSLTVLGGATVSSSPFAAVLQVHAVSGGVITQVAVISSGQYSVLPTSPTSVSGGTGTGATFNIGWLGQEVYPYSVFTQGYQTIDVLNVTLLWGNSRIVLGQMPYSEFNPTLRTYQNLMSRPVCFSKYGQSSIYIGPLPDQPYLAEFDTVVIPNKLVNTTDGDILQFPYTTPVAFYAAYKAKYKEQSYVEANTFHQEYIQKCKEALVQTMTRMIPNVYTSTY